MPRPRTRKTTSRKNYKSENNVSTVPWWRHTLWNAGRALVSAGATYYGGKAAGLLVGAGLQAFTPNYEWWDPLYHDGTYEARLDAPRVYPQQEPVELIEIDGRLWPVGATSGVGY